ncbi:M15 family metallopeptidase [Terrisporobacter sp.]|uniref:M15 family metallopeptidase n=1 Tax=Terrisporobacter sp. TaxID=1965305 RepID=UPI00263011FF|nr:M15 family metallopeptidase [Terrisporobacter sp.]
MNDSLSINNEGNSSNNISNRGKRYSKRLVKKKRKVKKIFRYVVLSTVILLIIQGITFFSSSGKENDDSEYNSVNASSKLGESSNLIDESNILILVNRENKIDETYIPNDLVIPNVKFISKNSPNKMLRKETALQLENMFEDAKKEGINLLAVSGYRSYEYQKELYDKKVKRSGKEEADKYVAVPGTSEHQTGFVMDVLSSEYNKLDEGFKYTDAYDWLCNNMDKYGFIIRYPEGKEDITGYEYEPWHLRYVGKEAAKEINDKDITLEEYIENNNVK